MPPIVDKERLTNINKTNWNRFTNVNRRTDLQTSIRYTNLSEFTGHTDLLTSIGRTDLPELPGRQIYKN